MKKSIHELKTSRGAEDAENLKLLQRVAVKDKVAFEKLYIRFYPQLTRYLSRLMRRPELVEEVVNDTLFVVWEKAEQFQVRSQVSTWVTGIAYLKGIKAPRSSAKDARTTSREPCRGRGHRGITEPNCKTGPW